MTDLTLPLGATPENPFIGRRKPAHAAGARYYARPGLVCKSGHTPTIRTTSNHGCIFCDMEWRKENQVALKKQRRGFYQKNKTRLNATNKLRYAANPELRKTLAKKSALANPERTRKNLRTWQDNNAEYLRGYYNDWRIGNPDKVAAKAHKRRAAKMESYEHFTGDQVRELYASQSGCCAYCTCELNGKYECDHIVPLSRKGSNGIRNIAIACKRCNRRKRDFSVAVFAAKYGYTINLIGEYRNPRY